MTAAQQAVQVVLDQYVRDGRELGLQAAAWLNGEQVVDAWAGVADRASGRPMDGETLVTVFSVTKGIASLAMHLLAERGQITYDTAMAEYVPEFGVLPMPATARRFAARSPTGGVMPRSMVRLKAMVALCTAMGEQGLPGEAPREAASGRACLAGRLLAALAALPERGLRPVAVAGAR